ncbi:MAG: 4-hydroxy-tetrahydrodipicolinate reductase [Rhodospirillales bacterium]|nr:4-hydroxy-tetrahydrodipicolinate reductase [Rhodospirillales bacterium]
MESVKIGVVGCAGRMGRMLLRCVQQTPGAELAGGTEAPGSEALGRDLGELAGLGALGLAAGDDPVTLFARSQAVVDFTVPTASVAHAELAAQAKAAHVIGTTGLDEAQQAALGRAAIHTAVVAAPNMSLGVTLLASLVEQVARALDADYDIEVLEMHHRRKVDAPSGTALALGRAAAAGRGVALDEVARRVRDGHTGARPRGEIGFATLRGGDVVGDHSVIFAAEGERIELTHKASTREVFARGAVKAALWAVGQPPGLYSMKDVLGLA